MHAVQFSDEPKRHTVQQLQQSPQHRFQFSHILAQHWQIKAQKQVIVRIVAKVTTKYKEIDNHPIRDDIVFCEILQDWIYLS